MRLKDRKIRQAALFYAIALGLAIALAASAPLIGPGVLLLTMSTPAVAVVICRTVSPEGQRFRLAELGLARLGLRYWPFALIVPLAALLPGYLLVWGTGIGSLGVASGGSSLLQVAVSFVISIVFGAALGALGEEVGWRGYLLPRLVDTIGIGPAGLLSGFLHGLWHVPLILLTPYYLSEAPALVIVPLFLTLVTLSGPVFAYLRIASEHRARRADAPRLERLLGHVREHHDQLQRCPSRLPQWRKRRRVDPDAGGDLSASLTTSARHWISGQCNLTREVRPHRDDSSFPNLAFQRALLQIVSPRATYAGRSRWRLDSLR